MEQSVIFGPVFAMLALTFVVWVYLYIRRIPFIRSYDFGDTPITPEALARVSPPAVANPSDNLKNLFEMPVLFYTLSIYLYAVSAVDPLYLSAAWLFVTFRALHSAVHCTVNVILLRFGLYLVSSCALWFIAARAGLAYLTGQP